jgi:uncharacterized protein (TIGR02996 family)
MTDREALHRAILADPDDDTLRLAYADLLEEEDEPDWAAFVREQVALGRLPEYDAAWVTGGDPSGLPPRLRQALGPLPEGLSWPPQPFHRGFPAAVSAESASAFLAHADELFARFPVESVSLGVVRLSEAREFTRCRWLPRLRRLEVSEGLSGQAAERLLDSPRYVRLRELQIGAGLTTPSTAAAVLRSPVFKQLTGLGSRNDRGGGRALVDGLIRLADPPRLRSLNLAGNRLTAGQLPPLLTAPALAQLEELDLSDNNLGPEGVQALAAGPLERLRALRLQRTRPGLAGVSVLGSLLGRLGLRLLALGDNHLPPAAASVLTAGPGLAGLHTLDLRGNRLGDAGAQALAACPRLRDLVYLDLSENQIEDAGAQALADSPYLDGLRVLCLGGNALTPAAVARLRDRFRDALTI